MDVEIKTSSGKQTKTLSAAEMKSFAQFDDSVRSALFSQIYATLSTDSERIALMKKFVCREVFW